MAFPLTDAEHVAIRARIESQPELVVAAAVRTRGVIVMAERPGRHANCINFLHRLGSDDYRDQGFVTNRGRFVDREEAARIVEASGQGSRRKGLMGLFSEDMWNDADDEMAKRHTLRPDEIF